MPWKVWASSLITNKLKSQNIPIKGFTIDSISDSQTNLSNIIISTEPEIVIPKIKIKYDIENAINLEFNSVEIDSLTYKIAPNKDKSDIEGFKLKNFPSPTLLKNVPVEFIKANNIKIIYKDEKNISADFIIDAQINTKLQTIKANFKQANITAYEQSYAIKGAKLSLSGNGKAKQPYYVIEGTIDEAKLTSDKNPVAWLPLYLHTTGELSSSELSLNIKARHKDFNITSKIANNSLGTNIKQLKVNVAGGIISASNIPIDKSKFETKFNINSVSLEKLLKFILKDDKSIKATGNISGTVPLRKNAKGFNIEGSNMYNLTNGVLSLSEQHLQALPQNVEQVKNTSDLLKNFMYDDLKLTTNKHNEKLEISLKLQGNNPEVYNGATVNLNINFRGDIIESIRSMLGFDDISKYKENR
jgi:hypothetical protein